MEKLLSCGVIILNVLWHLWWRQLVGHSTSSASESTDGQGPPSSIKRHRGRLLKILHLAILSYMYNPAFNLILIA